MATLDPAIAKALSIDPFSSTIKPHGGSNFAKIFKVTSTLNSRPKSFFVKTAKGEDADVMFTGEHASLTSLSTVVPSLCPRSHAHGEMSLSPGTYFLATDFIDFSPHPQASSQASGSGLSLAQKLARLHSTPAPIPQGFEKAQFGFPVRTACGDTLQDNTFSSSWEEFFVQRRLGHILRVAEKNNGPDDELSRLVTRVMREVGPRLLANGHLRQSNGEAILPVLVHGDLWSGNHAREVMNGEGEAVEEVVFDPSACYVHGEYEWGIMRMFGGFGGEFERTYWAEVEMIKGGKDEPVEEFEDRVSLYELYHHLNHYAIFGKGYRNGAVRIMERLVEKYGNEGDLQG